MEGRNGKRLKAGMEGEGWTEGMEEWAKDGWAKDGRKESIQCHHEMKQKQSHKTSYW